MAEQSGEGEFKGSGEFVARLTDIAKTLDRFEVKLSSVDDGQKSLRTDIVAELGKTRTDIMGKVEELRSEVATISDDISVNMGAVDSVRRAHNNTREEMRDLGDSISALNRKLAKLEAQVRELKGDT